VTATVQRNVGRILPPEPAASNPRSLSISVTFAAAQPAPYALTYVGTLNDSLSTWSGTVTGFHRLPVRLHATGNRPSTDVTARLRISVSRQRAVEIKPEQLRISPITAADTIRMT